MKEIRGFRGRYRFLSNFYADPRTHATVEAFFQAAKSQKSEERDAIRKMSPRDAKWFGRRVILRPDWEQVKQEVMFDLLLDKFHNHGLFIGMDYQASLAATGSATLIESNTWHDNYWGDCTCPRCTAPGQNHLGLLLMEVRESITTTNIKLIRSSRHD